VPKYYARVSFSLYIEAKSAEEGAKIARIGARLTTKGPISEVIGPLLDEIHEISDVEDEKE
jgi:hypothetical protein